MVGHTPVTPCAYAPSRIRLRKKGILRPWTSACSTYSGFKPSTDIMSTDAASAAFAPASASSANGSKRHARTHGARWFFTYPSSLADSNGVVRVGTAETPHFHLGLGVAARIAQRVDIGEPRRGISLARCCERRARRFALEEPHLHDARLVIHFLRLRAKHHGEHHRQRE